jgi:hypothetical protein
MGELQFPLTVAAVKEYEATHWQCMWEMGDALLADIPWSQAEAETNRDLREFADGLLAQDKWEPLFHVMSKQSRTTPTPRKLVNRLKAIRAAAHAFPPDLRDPKIKIEHYLDPEYRRLLDMEED